MELIHPGESTADLCDRLGARARVCHLPWRSYGGLQAASGTVACVEAFEDAGPVRAMLETPGAGRILVVDGGGSLHVALLGDRLAQLGLDHGWRGAIVHGAVRDVATLAAMDFAVFALGAVPRRASGSAWCQSPAVLTFAGVRVSCGEVVNLDADGVVFVGGA